MKINRRIFYQSKNRRIAWVSINLLIIITIFFLTVISSNAIKNNLEEHLPPLQIHPLPTSLINWEDTTNSDDYFDEIQSTLDGYLIWSEFPIKVYFDRPLNPDDPAATTRRFNQWVTAIETAINEWNTYLPIKEISQPETADIIIERTDPPLGTTIDPETGKLQIPRARTAQTRYEFYLKNEHLLHKMTIQISPRLSELSSLSAARHELGHALGIWGHSQQETDALYFSQVANSPQISPRDINTLKKIYEQPTRLGWPLPKD